MSHRWPNLQNLIDSNGEVTVSCRASVGRVATAMQERQVHALLRVDDGELVPDILDRLDAAVYKAVEEEIFTDEINPQNSVKTHSPHAYRHRVVLVDAQAGARGNFPQYQPDAPESLCAGVRGEAQHP